MYLAVCKLSYHQTGKEMECYVDADWGGDNSDRRYESKKQSTVALISTEAEYMALTSAVKDAVFLQKLLGEMKLECPKTISVSCKKQTHRHKISLNTGYLSRRRHQYQILLQQ